MKFIKLFEEYSAQERQDDILDKISSQGIESLTDDERRFLDSFKDGKQDIVNDELNGPVENFDDNYFDDNLFSFKLRNVEDREYEVEFFGELTVPDPFKEDGQISLEGSFKLFRDSRQILPEFSNSEYDVYELITDLTYELDGFLDYVVSELGFNDDELEY